MSLIGVSMLEMRQMIEQACLPDRCEVSCADGAHLTIRLGQGQRLEEGVTLTGVALQDGYSAPPSTPNAMAAPSAASVTAKIRLSTVASNEEVEEMKEVFACFDKDSSGAVTTAELALVLKSLNKHYSDEELHRIIGRFDRNGDGEIDFDEFMQMMKKHESGTKEEVDELRQAFAVFDKDGDGKISAKELDLVMRALGEPIDRQTIDLMIESVDTDKSGFIDFEEFRQMMKDGPVELAKE